MLVLFETPAGFALFKVLDEGKLSKVEDLWKEFATSESARKIVKLKAFTKFENTSEALSAATLLIDSKPSKGLRKFLRTHCEGETLAVADSKLGNAIKEKLQIECLHNNAVMELMRGVRSQLAELILGLAVQDLAPMSLGLSHSLSRYKLKFSPDKVDTMIIQAIGLLDDLDKELNTYAMRVREWYGWHFPELAKIVQDNILYAKTVKLMGNRTNAVDLDFSEILPEETEAELKEAAVISMGTEVSDLDLTNIKALCDQVLALSEYRAQLYDYLRSRMNTIAPNLTALVGELVGARLIAHGGSLLNLAKQPGSTVQILGAEKALFRALKTKHATPKYGLIFHASLIGQAAPKLKGKISRSLAAKAALAIRYDALGDSVDNSMGLENRAKLEARLRSLEGRELGRSASLIKGKPKIEAYDKDRKKGAGALITAAKTYNPAADSVLGTALVPMAEILADERAETPAKNKKRKEAEPQQTEVAGEGAAHENGDKKKEKKKKKRQQSELEDANLQVEGLKNVEPNHEEMVTKEKKKKKRRHVEVEEDTDAQTKEQEADTNASFAILIAIFGLVLFAHLIGNMQTYLQSLTVRLEEWRLKQRDTEEWMKHRQLPHDLRERVRQFVQYKWLATRGVDGQSILRALPTDLRRDIQRHLCLDLVRRVPFFSQMDDQLLNAICERLVSSLSTEGTYIVREGDPVTEMLFIIRGRLESSTTNGGRSGFFNSITLRPGDFCSEELLAWALLPKSTLSLPISTRTVRTLVEVEAFALQVEDVKFVANQFRRLHSKKLQHTFRFYSHQWRTWAACFIQAAWHRFKRRKMEKDLRLQESLSFVSNEHVVDGMEQEEGDMDSPSANSSYAKQNFGVMILASRFATNTRKGALKIKSVDMPKLQKPEEPDFSADPDDHE